ncbi:hypothetical protein BDV96DRAFT_653916 [Lophiotrema nucula]|uniref:Uncharacterized protein n=1 Tax=Lophiotrema nucula TaxID=690887 RepID=A0A6A5YJT1_9PLEO|nr:hypothetical protein BDV96DRAFT_653916 [Lophiotrema nucula]
MFWFIVPLLCAPFALAFDSASLPATVTAGDEFPVTVAVDPETQPYKNWQDYRVYLSDYESYYGVNYPFCFLSDILSFEDLTSNAVIPKDAVPDGDTYALLLHEFNQTWQPDQESGLAYSEQFTVTGSNIKAYSEEEWAGPNQIFVDLPCSALDCSRKCKEKTLATKTAAFWTYSDYCACVAKCPGVVTEGAYEGHYADGCGSDWERLKSGGTASATSTSDSTQASSASFETTESAVTTDSTTPARSRATTTPAGAVTATTNANSPSSTGAAAHLLPSAFAAGALVALFS